MGKLMTVQFISMVSEDEYHDVPIQYIVTSDDTGELAAFLAKSALKNNQLADILMGAAGLLHDADWRSKQLIETF